MIRTTLQVLAAVVLVAAALPSGEAAKATANSANVSFTIESTTSGKAEIEQSWNDQAAKSMRQSLDAFFGAGDGKLTNEELGLIATASENDMRSQTLPFLLFDGKAAIIRDVNLTITGAQGSVVSLTPMSMKHTLTLDLADSGNGEHIVTVNPLWAGTLTVTAPEGWTVGETTGIDRVADSTGPITGAIAAERAAKIPYSTGGPSVNPPPIGTSPPPDATPTESNPGHPEGPILPVPAGGLGVVMGALALASFVVLVRRRRVP